MNVIIYFNENGLYKKECIENVKMIETIDNKLIILIEKCKFVKYDIYY